MPRRVLPLVELLWINYPLVQKPCNQPFENQCAIRVSVALEKCGFPLTGYTEPKCKHGHARGAEALANYLTKVAGKPFVSIGTEGFSDKLTIEQGIIFFKDIEGFRGGIGDHIDLCFWGKTKTGNYFEKAKQTWFWSLY